MKRSITYKLSTFLFFLFFIISTSVIAQQTSTNAWTEKSAKKWVKSRQWNNGLSLKVNPTVNNIEFAKQYHANQAYWDKAFLFMREKNLKEMVPGKYVIDGDNVFATITDAPSKEFEQSAWESHRKYIDLQYVITGKEKIGVSALADATVIKPYDETKDLANYSAAGKYFIATPEEFFLFFPNDVHRPNIKVEGFNIVKKLVIKIRYAN
jgi:YhcH/YjgK/YiaL family protein